MEKQCVQILLLLIISNPLNFKKINQNQIELKNFK